MGRHVTSRDGLDFNYKFILGSQSSNFGEHLESFLCGTSFFIERYVSDMGEIVILSLYDTINHLIEILEVELENNKETVKRVQDKDLWNLWSIGKMQWNESSCTLFMLSEFKEWLEKQDKDLKTLEFYVEY
jgi:hypothetical protein